MKAEGKFLFVILLLIMVFSFPRSAFAQTDQYGYDAQKRVYIGTLDNWEAFLQGLPPTPFDWDQKDTIFIERKWDELFDPMIQGNPPSAPGAWQEANLWKYLSGDKLGWTWHQKLKVVYSPYTPIPDAIELSPDEIPFTGFYLVEQKECLKGPNREETIIQDFSVDHDIIKKALNLLNWGHQKQLHKLQKAIGQLP